ncbi:MAG: lamin tail domain-containing protein [Kiritimatiellae bacterium]|nr:lamin tail domain-containing protein [Kiritimatiellia bacterium]
MRNTLPHVICGLAICLFVFSLPTTVLSAPTVVINEFMASNDTTLQDEDGDYTDWVELYNAGGAPVNLAGWELRDSADRWTFPATNLAAGAYLLVFASGKDRATVGRRLHTDFRLDGDGEYLALVDPEGSIATKFAPAYPAQAPDISYGVRTDAEMAVLLGPGAACKWHVPVDGALGTSWTAREGFADGSWQSGVTGVGYETGSGYEALIGADTRAAMAGKNTSVYIRIPFTVADPDQINSLILKIKYDDGFVAYLNGNEIMRENASGQPPAWNAAATASHPDEQAVVFEAYDISAELEYVVAGENILAIHGLNDATGSSDFLILPQLEAALGTAARAEYGYFNVPTPGAVNGTGSTDLGPAIKDVGHTPRLPSDSDDILVSARVLDTGDGISSVTLRYLVMWSTAGSAAMYDDGAHDDGAAGDGTYGARIPASVSTPGQMVRYYVEAKDGAGHTGRFPLEDDTIDYLGTVIENPAIATPLPVYHLFFKNPQWYMNSECVGNRTWQTGCFYYNGEFYDNIRSRGRGGVTLNSSYCNRKKLKIEFKDGHYFAFAPEHRRVDEFNLGRSYIDEPVAYEMFRKNGAGSICFPIHVRMNGAFWDLGVFLEQLDWRYLDRNGLDPDGALYKAKNSPSACLASTAGFQIKSRLEKELNDWSHLRTLANGLQLSGTARRDFLFDNVNVAEVVNWIAMASVVGYTDRTYKNYYVYRDTHGNGEFGLLPWDTDDALREAQADHKYGGHPFFGDFWHPQGESQTNNYNRFYSAIYHTPETSEMYLRRLRSVRDEFLAPSRVIQDRVDYWAKVLIDDGALSYDRWHNGWDLKFFTNNANGYLAKRPAYLDAHDLVPASQPANPAVDFGTVEFNPASHNQDQEYIELVNPNAYAVDISGWCLSNAVEHTFQAGVVIRANSSMYVSPNVVAFRARTTSPKAGEGRFVQGAYKGQLSAWGETIELWRRNGTRAATLAYPGNPSAAQRYLRITEIMYNPDAGEDYEFIELQNTASGTLDIGNVSFVDGITFTFPAGTKLAAGEYIVVVHNLPAFQALYGTGVRVAGQYAGALDNGGERLELRDACNEKILSFEYRDGWYAGTDGDGFSLVIKDPAPHDNAHWEDKASWRASYTYAGSPGKDDVDLGVVINEVLTHTDPPLEDAIELRNTKSASVDIGGWYLSDELTNLKKYRIPNGTAIAAGGYKVFYEYQFNADTNNPSCFALSSHGEKLWLCAADAAGNLTGYRAFAEFGAADNGVSFGRYVRSDGQVDYPAMSSRTFGVDNPTSLAQFRTGAGKANSGPKIGPIVINEIMYNPAGDGYEFVELRNISGSTVNLYDPANPANRWKLTGAADYVFPAGAELGAGAYAVVGGVHPTVLRAACGIPASVQVFGPWLGALDNAGESVRLRKPDAPDPEAGGLVPYVLVDEVRYDNKAPWPPEPAGNGPALEKISAGSYGNDPVNWAAGGNGGTPGRANDLAPTPPAAPSAPAAVAVSGTRVDLSWRDNSGNESGFRIDRRMSGETVWVRVATAAANATTHSDTGLTPLTDYYYKLNAYNGAGSSAYSATVAVTTLSNLVPPAAPSGLTAQAEGPTEVRLAWTDNSGNEDGFKIERRVSGGTWAQLAVAGANATAYADTSAAPETEYRYQVRAYNPAGDSAYSELASVTTPALPTPPAAPSAMTATALSFSRVRLTWADNSDNEQGFKIDRRQSGTSEWVRIVTAGSDTTEHTDSGVTANTTFYYKAKAYNAAGQSAYSAVAYANTPSDTAPREWVAYHDLGWMDGQPSANITTIPAGSTELVDYATGRGMGITLNITSGGAVGHWNESNPAPGTEAYALFAGKLDCNGFISSSQDPIVLEFAGLDPKHAYEIVLFGNRAGGYLDRLTTATLSGVDAFENASTPGATFSGPDDPAVTICNGENTANGYVARFVNVLPGAEGKAVLTATVAQRAVYLTALRLRKVEPQAHPKDDGDTDGMSDAWEQSHFGGTAANQGGADDDRDGDGMSNWEEYVAGTDPNAGDEYLNVTIAILNGAPAVSFATRAATGTAYEGLTRHYALERRLGITGTWCPVDGYVDILGAGQTVTCADLPNSTEPLHCRVRVWLAAE